MSRLVLYSTSACHLCEQAEALLHARERAGAAVAYRVVDIAESDELFERYGTRIPVLQRADGCELDWPFDSETLAGFIG